MRLKALWGALICCSLQASTAYASGPRWVTGPPYFSVSGTPVVWYTGQPLYFTDPGDLSIYVNHATADALVAAAVAVWNAPTSGLTLAQGGTLAEHPSEANTFLGPDGVIFPSDIQSANYANIQIAVLYDSDGSITDLLLGNGASDPSSCLQNGVTESVDSITPAGYIQHAVVMINGRCTGAATEAQTQLEYQLVRVFGRVLGLGWSQTNDNVFTESPQPTEQQALNWPIMHPIDIICGPYTYQCMPQPFTLRADDLAGLALLYPIAQGQAPPGKVDTLYEASLLSGSVSFPNGQQMQGVNVLVKRWEQYTSAAEQEDWYTASAVSGALFRQSNGNAVSAADDSLAGSQGSLNLGLEGEYEFARVPMLPGDWQALIYDVEPINPLYVGQYAVGPYIPNTVLPSGTYPETVLNGLFGSYRQAYGINVSLNNSAASCNTSGDGTENAPASVPSTGWWSGQLCGYGHAAWTSVGMKPQRSLTIEVTAEDEQGFASSAKAMPVIGVWNASDPTGTLPTVAGAAQAFSGATTGMTALSLASSSTATLRMVIADQRGDGRPDYNYGARILYADSISPANLSAQGGTVTITGTGFRTGNTVTIDGHAATVTNWSANTIVATAPSLTTLGQTVAFNADVTVTDLSTGGTSTMTGALSYSAPAPYMQLLTAPSGIVAVGQIAAIPFSVQALAADGVTPLINQTVAISATSGLVRLAACGAASCTLQTNAQGTISTAVTPLAAGAILLEASSAYGAVTANFNALVPVQGITANKAAEYVAAGSAVSWPVQATVVSNLASFSGVPVQWETLSGFIAAGSTQTLTDNYGTTLNTIQIAPMTAGAQAQVSACVFTTVCTVFSSYGVDPATVLVSVVNGANQEIPAASTLAPVVLLVTDQQGDPVAGAGVQIDQTVQAWQPPCPVHGRCPVPPVYTTSQQQVTSDVDGQIVITPLQVPGAPGVTHIAAETGSQGFASVTLQTDP